MSDSLESQIKAARKRAEDFSLSLEKARQEEMESMKAIELERKKWTKSYDDKVVMIEQLQRELAHTVEALHDKGTDLSNTLEYTNVPENSVSYEKSSLYDSSFVSTTEGEVGFYNQERPSDNITNQRQSPERNSFYPTKVSMYDAPIQSQRHFLSKSLPKTHATGEEESLVNSLQRENSTLKERISTLLRRESETAKESQQLKLQLEDITAAWRDSEAKLKFRNQQANENDVERESRDKIESGLRNQISNLEKILEARDEKCGRQEKYANEMEEKWSATETKNRQLADQNEKLSKRIEHLELLLHDRSEGSRAVSGSGVYQEGIDTVGSDLDVRYDKNHQVNAGSASHTEEELQNLIGRVQGTSLTNADDGKDNASESVLYIRGSLSPPRVAWNHSGTQSSNGDKQGGAMNHNHERDGDVPPPPPVDEEHVSPILSAIKKIVVKQQGNSDVTESESHGGKTVQSVHHSQEKPASHDLYRSDVNHPYAYMFQMIDKNNLGELTLNDFIEGLSSAGSSVAEVLLLPRVIRQSDGSLSRCVDAFNDMDYNNTHRIDIFKFLRYVDSNEGLRQVKSNDRRFCSPFGNDTSSDIRLAIHGSREDENNENENLDTSADIALDSSHEEIIEKSSLSSGQIMQGYKHKFDNNNSQTHDELPLTTKHIIPSSKPHSKAKSKDKPKLVKPKADKNPRQAGALRRIDMPARKPLHSPAVRTKSASSTGLATFKPTIDNKQSASSRASPKVPITHIPPKPKKSSIGSKVSVKRNEKITNKPQTSSRPTKKRKEMQSRRPTSKIIDRDSIDVASVRSSFSLQSKEGMHSSRDFFVHNKDKDKSSASTTKNNKLVRRQIERNASKYPLHANIHSTMSSSKKGSGVSKGKGSTGSHWK